MLPLGPPILSIVCRQTVNSNIKLNNIDDWTDYSGNGQPPWIRNGLPSDTFYLSDNQELLLTTNWWSDHSRFISL